MAHTSYSRADRKTMIIQNLAIMVQNRRKPEVTVAEMARKLNLEPSTHLRKIMQEMVEDEQLGCRIEPHRPGWEKRVYYLFPGTYTEPRARHIPIKVNGREQGQLELFS